MKCLKYASYTLLTLTLVLASFASQALQKGETLKVNTYPPVSYINESLNTVDGPVAALVKAVTKELGQAVEFQINPLPRMFVELDAHRAHAAFNMSHNEERAKKWHYSLPIHVVNYGVFVKKDDPLVYTSREQLAGRTIATYGPTNMSKKVEAFAAEIPGARVVVENDFEHVFKMLVADRFGDQGVVYAPDVVAQDTMKKLKMDTLRYAGPDKKNLYHIIFVKETVSKDFVDAFNAVLLKFHQDGTMAKIYAQYQDTTTNVPALEDMQPAP